MRQGTRRLGLPRTEIVFEAVFDNASLRDVTVKIEGLKIQLRQMAEQVRFFRDSNEFGLIEESLGQISRTRAFVSRHSDHLSAIIRCDRQNAGCRRLGLENYSRPIGTGEQ